MARESTHGKRESDPVIPTNNTKYTGSNWFKQSAKHRVERKILRLLPDIETNMSEMSRDSSWPWYLPHTRIAWNGTYSCTPVTQTETSKKTTLEPEMKYHFIQQMKLYIKLYHIFIIWKINDNHIYISL
jgi:hypothetical protein